MTSSKRKALIDRFRREILPVEFRGVFDLRFLGERAQRDAAAELGIPRSTLVYREEKVRELLRRFLLGKELS